MDCCFLMNKITHLKKYNQLPNFRHGAFLDCLRKWIARGIQKYSFECLGLETWIHSLFLCSFLILGSYFNSL